MGQKNPPKVYRSGRYVPTLARTGNLDNVIFRKQNLITRGRGASTYEESFSGMGDLSESIDPTALTGTIAVTANSTAIVGTTTAFLTELRLGQFVIIIKGSVSWLLVIKEIISNTSATVWKAPTASDSGFTGYRGPVLFAINNKRGSSLGGNALKLDRGSYLSAGMGVFRVNGSALQGSSLTMTVAPQISLFNPSTGNYTNFTLGMNTSVAPALAAVTSISISAGTNASPTVLTTATAHGLITGQRITISGATGSWTPINGEFPVTVTGTSAFSIAVNATGFGAFTGTVIFGGVKGMQAGNYSLVVTPARKETLGYNNPSERADVTIATGDMIQITFPAMDTARGQNAWIDWDTTFADTLGADLNYLNGPWHRRAMTTDEQVSTSGGVRLIEFLDAEIENNELVAFNNDAPTPAYFVELLNAVPVYISCQGPGNASNTSPTAPGPFIVPAKPNNIEAAPLELAYSSSPPETIIGAVAALGRLYLLTFLSLQIAQGTASDIVPILIRPFWKDGFANPYQLVFVNGNLYGFPVAGPSRSVGDGDQIEAERDWAEDVAEIVLTWNCGQVLVGYDPYNDAVIYFHSADRLNSSGFWTTRWLMFGISQNSWIGDGELTSATADQIVTGLATVGDRLELLIGGR